MSLNIHAKPFIPHAFFQFNIHQLGTKFAFLSKMHQNDIWAYMHNTGHMPSNADDIINSIQLLLCDNDSHNDALSFHSIADDIIDNLPLVLDDLDDNMSLDHIMSDDMMRDYLDAIMVPDIRQ